MYWELSIVRERLPDYTGRFLQDLRSLSRIPERSGCIWPIKVPTMWRWVTKRFDPSEKESLWAGIDAQNPGILWCRASLAYTWYYSEFKQLDENLQNTRRYIPSSWDNRHIFSLTATRRIGKSWDLGFKWRYVAGGPYTPYDRETSARIEAWEAKHQPYYDYSRFNTQRLPAFHQLDVRVDKSFFFRKWSLIFYADIQNIYNYKALGPDELVPVENPDGSYRKDPGREGYYQMQQHKK